MYVPTYPTPCRCSMHLLDVAQCCPSEAGSITPAGIHGNRKRMPHTAFCVFNSTLDSTDEWLKTLGRFVKRPYHHTRSPEGKISQEDSSNKGSTVAASEDSSVPGCALLGYDASLCTSTLQVYGNGIEVKQETRNQIHELLQCGYKKSCGGGKYKCHKETLKCTVLCQCGAQCEHDYRSDTVNDTQ